MKTLFLLDANALIHRAYHALPPFTNSEGKPTGALYGLSNILLKILSGEPSLKKKGQVDFGKPDFIAAFFDRPEPTFRKEIFEEYKIHRPKAPDALVSQIIDARDLFNAFGIKAFETPGYEADDLIGTSVRKFSSESNLKIIIMTGDLDTLQLVQDEKIIVNALKKGVSETVVYDENAVKERYGILPKELPDYKGLVGDASDNIPGVPGIGPKTAASLIRKYKTLENFFKKGEKEKIFEKISSFKDQAFLSKELSMIHLNSPMKLNNLNELKYSGLPEKKLIPYFEKMGFKSLVKRFESSPLRLF